MSDKEPPNPFDEIQKQLKELFKNSNVKISSHGFPEGDPFQDEPEAVSYTHLTLPTILLV